MTVEIHISSIVLMGGSTIDVPPTGMVVIVGPNNVGKSLTINEALA
jgi:ABC-type branched-subunit amino acid transport system ATPase component